MGDRCRRNALIGAVQKQAMTAKKESSDACLLTMLARLPCFTAEEIVVYRVNGRQSRKLVVVKFVVSSLVSDGLAMLKVQDAVLNWLCWKELSTNCRPPKHQYNHSYQH